jgi:glycerate 2-kinase
LLYSVCMSLAKLREDALTIFHAGLKAVDPARAVTKYLRRQGQKLNVNGQVYDLPDYDGVYVVGMGKAAAAMAQAVEEILGDRLESGIVNVKYGYALPLHTVKVKEAGHPVPDKAGLEGTEEIIELLRQTGERDLVICLISGGGSALLPYPAEGLTLEDKQHVTRLLLECGATIHEINAVRKHISKVKGGKLARLAHPSTLISLILSDVIGDNLDTIASGPTVPDESTFADCLDILNKYGMEEKVPGAVLKALMDGSRGVIEETPKADDPVFRRTQNVIVGSNILALKAAKQKAQELGYNSLILSSFIEGETREVAKAHTAIAKEILSTGNPIEAPACIISGGETTVTIRGNGLGGRNQEFALVSAIGIDGLDKTVILSGGTDGTDGPTDAAGAIVDGTTVQRASEIGLDAERYLDENDSYHFFKALGDLIITGPTRTNVMDLRLALVGD